MSAGFDIAGVARPDPPPELSFFREWVSKGYAGGMAYLTSQQAKRQDLRVAFPWAVSVLCLGLQYDTPQPYSTSVARGRGWISRYAWGDDYHVVMTRMLERFVAALERELGPCRARVYVDTGPIVERAYAAAAGIGAWGKNTCLLHSEHGSWFFLAEVVTDLDLAADQPLSDMCGSCTACIDACPTQALRAPYVLDARRCISYTTIELRGPIPEGGREGIGHHVFGCDICQDVCPWNRKRRHRGPRAFEPRPGLLSPRLETLARLDQAAFSERFRGSPVKRAKRQGFLRNVTVALANLEQPSRRALERLARDPDPVVSEHALWALERLSQDPSGSSQAD